MTKLALRMAALSPFALFASAACSSSSPTPASTSCGNVAQCPAGQACLNNTTCVPIQNGTAGNGTVGTAGNGTVGAAGNGTVGTAGNGTVGTAGAAGSTGVPGGGSGNSAGAPGAGGTSATAGAGQVGTAGAAGSNTTAGAGYWTSKDWHGCSWTGVGTDGVSTVNPKDFTTKPAADAYCVSGTVGAEPAYKSVALLGFNVNEPSTASCVYKPVDTTAKGPPSVVPTADGLAINFVKKGTDTSFTLRAQIQGPNGAMAGAAGDADRWCATITAVQGKVFVPWASFTPSCWETTAAKMGTPYAKQPISAVVFTVPGKLTDTPYSYCINGFTYGTTAADAPNGPETVGDQSGKIGGAGGTDLDFARAKVNVEGHDYVIQNNNWGNPSGTDLELTYKNNSFKITAGSGSGGDAPASFPSIYIGASGNTANGVYSTHPGDNLPLQISAIKSVTSSFRYSGSTSVFNATYDIWFANAIPTATYNDGIDGFVMIWLRDPSGKQPIGTVQTISGSSDNTVTIAGMKWKVWKGPRGAGPMGSQSSAPVVSFVNPVEDDNSRAQNFTNINIKDFMTAAAAYGISGSMYLTDVFAGFEIWNGGSGGNLAVDEFKAVVAK
ncbi:MAG TPA: hypothetical protein VER12_17020 [Polyangiaceae bacterium]|nr:hypothetical protein [Polyangiaceae bacterium]